MKDTIIWPVIVIALVFGGLWWVNARDKKIETEMTSREVALKCTTDMATEYHIHPELIIIVDGEEVFVPKNLGIEEGCMTSIHTHEEEHIIHVEAPVARDFTLGDFFAVWKKDFSSIKLLDHVVTEGAEIVVTVNGVPVDTFENTILRDKDKIVITYQTK